MIFFPWAVRYIDWVEKWPVEIKKSYYYFTTKSTNSSAWTWGNWSADILPDLNQHFSNSSFVKVKVKKVALQIYFMLQRPHQHGSLILALQILQWLTAVTWNKLCCYCCYWECGTGLWLLQTSKSAQISKNLLSIIVFWGSDLYVREFTTWTGKFQT